VLVCGSFIIPRVRHRLFFIVLVHLTIIPFIKNLQVKYVERL